jgi:4-carboxymuconolactone decarboxylase
MPSSTLHDLLLGVPHNRPRIVPVTDADDLPGGVAEMLASGWMHDGRPLNVPRTLAHHPRLLKRFSVFAGLFLLKSALPTRDRELLTLRSTFRAGTEYYFGHHILAAPESGISEADLARVTDPDAVWDGRDATLMKIADELVEHALLSDATWDEAAAFYDDSQLMEAILLPGFYRMVAGFVNTIEVQRESGVPGWPTTDPTVRNS